LTHYSSGRDPYLDGKVFGAREILACTGQQLIPDPLVSVPNFSRMVAILVRHRVPILDNGGTGLMDLGSGIMIRHNG